MHVRRNDEIQVISGDHKGATGRVLYVDVKKKRVVVEGVNRVHKHVRPTQANPQGGRIDKEAPIAISNVMPICSNRACARSGKPVRVSSIQGADGVKHRVCSVCRTPMGAS